MLNFHQFLLLSPLRVSLWRWVGWFNHHKDTQKISLSLMQRSLIIYKRHEFMADKCDFLLCKTPPILTICWKNDFVKKYLKKLHFGTCGSREFNPESNWLLEGYKVDWTIKVKNHQLNCYLETLFTPFDYYFIIIVFQKNKIILSRRLLIRSISICHDSISIWYENIC